VRVLATGIRVFVLAIALLAIVVVAFLVTTA
jgi:hypothetical protein